MNIMNTHIPARGEDRPQWLKQASVADQTHYGELEQQLIASQMELEKHLGNLVSIATYARSMAGQALMQQFRYAMDPDTVMTHSRYGFQQDGRTFIQEDRRSLTDLLLHGLHDEGSRASISVRTEAGVSMPNPTWLMKLLAEDVRVAYSTQLRNLYQRADVIATMTQVTRDQLLQNAFAAKLQRHLGDSGFQRVRRALDGDASLIIAPLQLREDTRPLQGMLAIFSRAPDQDAWLLYAPDSPGGQDWYELTGQRQLSLEIGGWTNAPNGRDYLTWRSHALDREVIGGYLKRVSKLPGEWSGITLAPTPYIGVQALHTIVYNHRSWFVSQEESQTPYGYRSAPEEQRQTFTRIHCELRALRTIEVREGGFIPYGRFCRDLIKQRVEALLLSRGERVEINPDRIFVQIDVNQQATLTELIGRETRFYVDDVYKASYPRFHLATDHPLITKLDIRDIASWSRTLRPGEKYIDMLREVHFSHTHPEGRFKRQIYLGILRHQMKVAIMQARFTGRLTRESYEELMNVVAAFARPQPTFPVGEAPGDVRHSALFKFHIKGRLVVGVFVFRLHIAGNVEEYLFTPDAPDGCELRPFKDFVSAVKTRGLGDYFYARARMKDQPLFGTYLNSLELLANFIEAPTLERNSRVTDLHEAYDDVLFKVIADVDEQTTSLEEIITRLVFNAVVAAASTISVVYPPAGIALGAALFSKNIVQGVEAYSDGNRAKALKHFTDALIELAALGKTGYGMTQATKLQKDLIGLLGDVYTVEKLFAQISGQPRLHERALEVIQEILDDPESMASKTTLI